MKKIFISIISVFFISLFFVPNVSFAVGILDGVCGTANGHTYLSTDTGWGNYTLCEAGDDIRAVFPETGGTDQWACLGEAGGANTCCSANREPVPISPVCGTADGHTYSTSDTNWGSYTLCDSGTVGAVSGSVVFPNLGDTSQWFCTGNTGDVVYCDANRDDFAFTNPECGTANGHTYSTTDTDWGSRTLCHIGDESGALFPLLGGSDQWTCVGESGSTPVNCVANRESHDKIDGACGTADGHTFESTDTNWGSYTFCSAGQESGASFPSIGGSDQWVCEGEGGGTRAICNAARGVAPIDGDCGTADGHTFTTSDVDWGSYTLCNSGMLEGGDFPSLGGTSNWVCAGIGGGNSDDCSANKADYAGVTETTDVDSTTIMVQYLVGYACTWVDTGRSYCHVWEDGVKLWWTQILISGSSCPAGMQLYPWPEVRNTCTSATTCGNMDGQHPGEGYNPIYGWTPVTTTVTTYTCTEIVNVNTWSDCSGGVQTAVAVQWNTRTSTSPITDCGNVPLTRPCCMPPSVDSLTINGDTADISTTLGTDFDVQWDFYSPGNNGYTCVFTPAPKSDTGAVETTTNQDRTTNSLFDSISVIDSLAAGLINPYTFACNHPDVGCGNVSHNINVAVVPKTLSVKIVAKNICDEVLSLTWPLQIVEPAKYTSTVSGGVGPYTFKWTDEYATNVAPDGSHSSITSYIERNYTTLGVHTVNVTVTDAFGTVANASRSILVEDERTEQ